MNVYQLLVSVGCKYIVYLPSIQAGMTGEVVANETSL